MRRWGNLFFALCASAALGCEQQIDLNVLALPDRDFETAIVAVTLGPQTEVTVVTRDEYPEGPVFFDAELSEREASTVTVTAVLYEETPSQLGVPLGPVAPGPLGEGGPIPERRARRVIQRRIVQDSPTEWASLSGLPLGLDDFRSLEFEGCTVFLSKLHALETYDPIQGMAELDDGRLVFITDDLPRYVVEDNPAPENDPHLFVLDDFDGEPASIEDAVPGMVDLLTSERVHGLAAGSRNRLWLSTQGDAGARLWTGTLDDGFTPVSSQRDAGSEFGDEPMLDLLVRPNPAGDVVVVQTAGGVVQEYDEARGIWTEVYVPEGHFTALTAQCSGSLNSFCGGLSEDPQTSTLYAFDAVLGESVTVIGPDETTIEMISDVPNDPPIIDAALTARGLVALRSVSGEFEVFERSGPGNWQRIGGPVGAQRPHTIHAYQRGFLLAGAFGLTIEYISDQRCEGIEGLAGTVTAAQSTSWGDAVVFTQAKAKENFQATWTPIWGGETQIAVIRSQY